MAALLRSSVRLGVARPVIVVAVLVLPVSLDQCSETG